MFSDILVRSDYSAGLLDCLNFKRSNYGSRKIERVGRERKAFLFGEDLIEAIFQRTGKHKLTKFVTLGGSRSKTVVLDFHQNSIKNFTFGRKCQTDESIGGGGGEGDGELGYLGSD